MLYEKVAFIARTALYVARGKGGTISVNPSSITVWMYPIRVFLFFVFFFNHRQASISIKHSRQRLDILYSCIRTESHRVPSRMLQLEASNSRCRPFLAFETAPDWISLTCEGADAQHVSDALSKCIHMWVFKARLATV